MKTIIQLLLAGILSMTAAVATANNLRHFSHGERLPDIELTGLLDHEPLFYQPGRNAKPAAILFFSIRPDFRKKRSLALLQELDHIAEEYRGKVDMLAVYSDDANDEVVAQFARQNINRLAIGQDDDQQVYNRYGVFMMPLVVLIDAGGDLHEVIPYTYNIREIIDANLKLLLGIWDEKQFQQALQPKRTRAHSAKEKEYIRRINYGRVMMKRKMLSQALREFSTAVKLMPAKIDAYVELGFAQLALKKWSAAEESFRQALKIDSESDDAIAGLGLALYRQGDVEGALKELENALIAPTPRLEVIVALAEIHEAKGNITRAMRLNKLAVARLMSMYEHRWE